jgi:hypothetical protein
MGAPPGSLGARLAGGAALIAAACLACGGWTPLAAQPFEFLGWGVQGGIDGGYVDYAGELAGLDPGWGLGYTICSFAEFSLAGGICLQPGVRFDHFRNHSDVTMIHSRGSAEIVLDCVSLPLLAKAAVGAGPRLFFIGGPELGFVWKAQSRTRLENGRSSYDMGDRVDRINAALDAGLGVEFDAAGHTFFVQGWYCHGISSPAKEGYWIVDWRTREIALTAGVIF